ncbi:type II toxin-antitoxin system VapC family toxin [Acidobacteria bacterium AH-259-D05]|nr:type II toxin-antitoxin system VapC family toxin [Acidobacteria bacterium AH-259-D05]
MKGLDTNILVRYLVKDDPVQAATAVDFIHTASKEGEICFINNIVLCELVWVLESAYAYAKATIADVLERILLTEQFELEDRDSVWAGLALYKEEPGDFADYLIGRKNLGYGCARTVTFDRALAKAPDFELL